MIIKHLNTNLADLMMSIVKVLNGDGPYYISSFEEFSPFRVRRRIYEDIFNIFSYSPENYCIAYGNIRWIDNEEKQLLDIIST